MEEESSMETKVIYIGAENIVSPLGNTAEDNFEEIRKGKSALSLHSEDGFSCPYGKILNYDLLPELTKLESLMVHSIQSSLAQLNRDLEDSRTLLILSTTKGDIEHLAKGDVEKSKPTHLLEQVKSHLALKCSHTTISNACISGVLACIHGQDLIKQGAYDHVVVVGADLVSEFTYRGFESFFALSELPCRPFDQDRTGLSLGEGVATVVMSKDNRVYLKKPLAFLGGASANDANHISGPSREGEGLFRAITEAMKQASTTSDQIDFVNAHGTATRYNDDMESIAFHRARLESKAINSFKGYYGHTLGAAGVLELVLSMHSMRNDTLIKSLGFENEGTAKPLNVIADNESKEIRTVLKTASGFGGCNAAAILQKI
ncbi:MAG: beta-ketoacyl synthase N-terminal-like domain-containing protein [Reichenbachiella sp.]|uniref:beta-ketoacyl-[acyl-carrier-protein] synthase family protein n=1 Tax=Reichenbachiella sp. TaxID=2184521 RepID=UPI00326307F3